MTSNMAVNNNNNNDDQQEDPSDEQDADSLKEPILSKVFASCAGDPKGSVHRAWGVSLIFLVIYFILSIFEMLNLQSNGGSRALVLASIWTGILHLTLAILGTFVLKRFPTSFAIGFLVGILVVCANQNLILFGIFHGYAFGNPKTNHAFASLCFTLAMVLAFFTAILVHFRNDLVVAPVDVKGNSMRATSPHIHLGADSEKEEAFHYQKERT
mmetsp:Transcript_18978/g.31477  ORF Transcript_18978/g.31477 Transcript_18978/m.31477 type:complete len:213 (-) Transcript_18978:160-798(-)|eukprot:CAMPEP_0119011912 /NCGR_PEP_ID=MMETSP1176-20130426/5962_1 /TAXON_ID=265551 /ORGANISM="Synedropsis recta cf, Strain CCMP1620" /LENGTH=212 /DNA_ID=CAMNT_0006964789 /DNA_START=62 /DNA_END=700 /DNA_ORIENTATION=+